MTAQERREQLLDATKGIVVAEGFHAVSIEAVARAAGITRPIVYGHFADLAGCSTPWSSASRRARWRNSRPCWASTSAATCWARWRATWRRCAPTRHLAARADAAGGRAAHAGTSGSRRVGRRSSRGSPRALPPGGRQDPELIAHMLSAYADEAARLTLTDPERYPPERVLRLTRGLLAAPGFVALVRIYHAMWSCWLPAPRSPATESRLSSDVAGWASSTRHASSRSIASSP